MEAGIGRLERLQFSRREADVIRQLFPASERFSALDFDASRETLLSSALGDYRMVHIATHGLINSRHPELSGLVLSLVDRQGRTQNGFVQGYELYKLRLGADLVVLSACVPKFRAEGDTETDPPLDAVLDHAEVIVGGVEAVFQ